MVPISSLYDKVPKAAMLSRGFKAAPIRWVDVNKGDEEYWYVRSRLVTKQLKATTKNTFLARPVQCLRGR